MYALKGWTCVSNVYTNLGAKDAGLRESYINTLKAIEVYRAPDWLLDVRKNRPLPEALKPISMEELAKHKQDDVW